mgnify:FL=1
MNKNPPPQLTKEERARNGEIAKQARRDRANLKASIARGEISFFDALHDERASVKRMKVFDLLEAVPGVGEKRANLIMGKGKIAHSRRIGGLGRHQISSLRNEPLLKKQSSNRGLLVVMSGPGGVGKSTISNYLKGHPDFWLSISATTRAPREGESHGVDYFFVTDTEFDLMIKNGEFLEWAEFAGNRYGTPIKGVEEKLSLGKNVLLEIEIAGARQIRKLEMNALFVFISPPSWEELESRLISRGTDSEERRLARLALAREEMDAANEFDEILVNTAVNEVALALVSLVARKRGDF